MSKDKQERNKFWKLRACSTRVSMKNAGSSKLIVMSEEEGMLWCKGITKKEKQISINSSIPIKAFK